MVCLVTSDNVHEGFYKASVVQHHELLPRSQCFSLFVVVLPVLGLELLPYCPVSRKAPLHPHMSLILSHAVVRFNHCAGQHSGHLEVSNEKSDNRHFSYIGATCATHTLNCIVKPL